MLAVMSTALSATPERQDMDAEIGRRIFHLMWDRKITQTEMGNVINVGQTTLSMKLRGKRPWYSSELRAAATHLGTTVGYLFGEDDGVGPAGIEPTTSTVESRRFATVTDIRERFAS